MRINISIDEIEFEGGGIEFNFHDQIRIKKAFERELSRLFLNTTNENDNNRDFSISNILNNNNKIIFMSKNYGNINLIKEIDGGEFSFSDRGRNPSELGKRLANSIYSSLNLM